VNASTQIFEVDRSKSLTDQSLESIPPPRRRRRDLVTLSTVRREMGRIYRDMRMKKVESQDGARLVYVLSAIAKVIGESEIQKRVEAALDFLAVFATAIGLAKL
jgi:hypothetical protein